MKKNQEMKGTNSYSTDTSEDIKNKYFPFAKLKSTTNLKLSKSKESSRNH